MTAKEIQLEILKELRRIRYLLDKSEWGDSPHYGRNVPK